jgi:hypothetical protein
MPKAAAPRRVGRPSTKPKAREKATLGVRASPALKRLLQAAADRADRSLSAEMELRLEASFHDDRLGAAVFRDHATFALADEFVRVLRAVEITAGKSWSEDPQILLQALDVFRRFIEIAPEALAGSALEGLSGPTDAMALALLDVTLARQQTAQSAAPPADASPAPGEGELMQRMLRSLEEITRLLKAMQTEAASKAEPQAREKATPGGPESREDEARTES